MSTLRPLAVLVALTSSGCALFGDPLLGTWELVESDLDAPLTSTTTEDDISTTLSITGTLVFDTLEDGDLLGTYSRTVTTTQIGPEVNDTTSETEKSEAEATEQSKGEYEVEVDGYDDWICIIESSQLDCEDDDLNSLLFDRVGEGEK